MHLFTIAAVLSQLLALASAEIVQDDWTFPQSPEYATTIEIGQQITIGWTADLQTWFPADCPGCVPTSANLYITSVGISGQLPFKHKIASNIDVTFKLGFQWTVTLPVSEYTCDGCNAWAFMFAEDGYNGNVPSSTFYVTNATSSSTIGSTATTTATSTTSTIASSTTLVTSASSTSATTSPTAPATEPTTGLSDGAKAGIGVGAAVGALTLVAVGWFLARWRRPKNEGVPLATAVAGTSASPTKSEFEKTPRHRPLADFLRDTGGSPLWDPADSFYQPSDQRSATNLDDARMPTPESSSYELLSKPGRS